MDSPRIEIIKKRDDKLLVRISQNSEEWEHEYTQEKTFNDLINDYTNGTKNEFPNEIINYLNNQRNQEYSNERLIKDYINKYEEKDIVLYDDNKIPEMIGKPFNNPFCVFAFIKKQKILKMLKFENKELYGLNDYSPYTAYCNGDDKLYISGGEKGKKYIEKFWKIDLNTLDIECCDMIPKKNHSMIVIPGNYVFIVGGQDKETFFYDHENGRFFGWKSLKRNRTEPALILVNNYLYCFDNVYSQEFKNEFTFEKTDLNSENHEWELIQPIMDMPNMKMNQKFFGVVKKDDDILFIGGNMDYDEFKEEDGSNIAKNYKLNINSNKLEKSELPFTEYNLKEKSFLPYNENIYYIFPDFNKNHPEVIFYRKDKNKVQLVKYESQEESEENTVVIKKDLPPAKINRLDFNQPKLDEKLNNYELNINPINTDNNDNNKNSENKNEIKIEEDINKKIDDNFNNMNLNINTNENNINNMIEQNININVNPIEFTNKPENETQIKGKYNISSNLNIFKNLDESNQVVIGSTNENINLFNNNSNMNLEGANINININQDINNFEAQKNNFIEEKRSEEEKNEEISKSNINSNNTPTENLQILDDMLKSSKYEEKKTFESNKESQNVDNNNQNINYPQFNTNIEGYKKEDSKKDINIENSNIQINEVKQDTNINPKNVIKEEEKEFCLKGIIKGTKEKEKEKEKEKKDLKKEEKKKDIDIKSSTEFIITGIILGKKETDSKIIKIYNEKNKSQEKDKEKENKEKNNMNINAELNIDNLNQNNNNIKLENPFKSKMTSTDINNKIEINGNINSNPLNIELNKNTEDINKINFNFESKSPEIIGTDIKTPIQLPGNINENNNNNVQPFDINAQSKNIEINANIENKEKKDNDDFRLIGIIQGTKNLKIKKENKNESDENSNAKKIDINGNMLGVEVNQPKIEIEKQNQIEGNINLNGQKIISVENKENENNKKETKDLFCLTGVILPNKNKKKLKEPDKNNLQGKIENGGIKGENENQINANINNENIQAENLAINEQKIDNE